MRERNAEKIEAHLIRIAVINPPDVGAGPVEDPVVPPTPPREARNRIVVLIPDPPKHFVTVAVGDRNIEHREMDFGYFLSSVETSGCRYLACYFIRRNARLHDCRDCRSGTVDDDDRGVVSDFLAVTVENVDTACRIASDVVFAPSLWLFVNLP